MRNHKRHKERKRTDPYYRWRYNKKKALREKYGLSWDDFVGLLEKQDNRCALCRDEFEKIPDVDHCHKTGTVRGLLCRGCNLGLKFFKDDPSLVATAYDYLCQSEGESPEASQAGVSPQGLRSLGGPPGALDLAIHGGESGD